MIPMLLKYDTNKEYVFSDLIEFVRKFNLVEDVYEKFDVQIDNDNRNNKDKINEMIENAEVLNEEDLFEILITDLDGLYHYQKIGLNEHLVESVSSVAKHVDSYGNHDPEVLYKK